MNLNLKTEDIYFLTTNPKKTKDFISMGFSVMKNDNEPVEVLSPFSSEVALYKSKDTNINNAVVEDTSLSVEGAPCMGTQIKDYWNNIQNDEKYHGKKATWEISVCLSTDKYFIISTGVTEGYIKFPKVEDAYHFDQVFSIALDEEGKDLKHWITFPDDEREALSPRNKAVQALKKAIETNDFSAVTVVPKDFVKEWKGEYQSEDIVKSTVSSAKIRMK